MPPGRWDVRRFDRVRSTNTWLLEAARRGVPAGTVAVADQQVAGRGRLGRHWEAPAGGCLLVSVLVRPVAPLDALYACTAAVALAAADAASGAAGVTADLKWPNDLVVGDRKLAGVLAESDAGAPGGRPGSVAVVVGLGMNVAWPGPDPERTTGLAVSSGHPVDRSVLLDALLEALSPGVDALDSAAGRARLVDSARARCVTLGRDVRVERPGAAPLEGRAETMTDLGHLVVRTLDGPVVVAVGDVVHVRPGGEDGHGGGGGGGGEDGHGHGHGHGGGGEDGHGHGHGGGGGLG